MPFPHEASHVVPFPIVPEKQLPLHIFGCWHEPLQLPYVYGLIFHFRICSPRNSVSPMHRTILPSASNSLSDILAVLRRLSTWTSVVFRTCAVCSPAAEVSATGVPVDPTVNRLLPDTAHTLGSVGRRGDVFLLQNFPQQTCQNSKTSIFHSSITPTGHSKHQQERSVQERAALKGSSPEVVHHGVHSSCTPLLGQWNTERRQTPSGAYYVCMLALRSVLHRVDPTLLTPCVLRQDLPRSSCEMVR